MLTDEQIVTLIQELSAQIDKLDDDDKLTGKERSCQSMLHQRREALKKIQSAREKGSLQQEIRAILDYNLLTEYGHNPILLHFMKIRCTHLGI